MTTIPGGHWAPMSASYLGAEFRARGRGGDSGGGDDGGGGGGGGAGPRLSRTWLRVVLCVPAEISTRCCDPVARFGPRLLRGPVVDPLPAEMPKIKSGASVRRRERLKQRGALKSAGGGDSQEGAGVGSNLLGGPSREGADQDLGRDSEACHGQFFRSALSSGVPGARRLWLPLQ